MGVQKARCGAVRVRQVSPLVMMKSVGTTTSDGPFEVIGQDWSSEVTTLFLKELELGRVAWSCHMAMDLLCQEMRGARLVSSK